MPYRSSWGSSQTMGTDRCTGSPFLNMSNLPSTVKRMSQVECTEHLAPRLDTQFTSANFENQRGSAPGGMNLNRDWGFEGGGEAGGSDVNRHRGAGFPAHLRLCYSRSFLGIGRMRGNGRRFLAAPASYLSDICQQYSFRANSLPHLPKRSVALPSDKTIVGTQRLTLQGADSILAPGRLHRRLPEHWRLCSLGTQSHSQLAQVDRPRVINQQPGSFRPS